MSKIGIAAIAGALLLAAAPANATWRDGSSEAEGGASSGSTQVPEPADFVLFAIGVIGLLIGRRGSRARRNKADEAA